MTSHTMELYSHTGWAQKRWYSCGVFGSSTSTKLQRILENSSHISAMVYYSSVQAGVSHLMPHICDSLPPTKE